MNSLTLDAPPQLSAAVLSDPEKFIYWKKRFEVYVKSKSLRLWSIIEFGEYIARSPDGWKIKTQSEWSREDKEQISENYLAIHLLYSALSEEDFKMIFFCDTARDIWKALGILHDGKYKHQTIKDSEINDVTQDFENFEFLPYFDNISIEYVCFKRIINRLEALGKTYSNKECVEKFLNALFPASLWDIKVNAIREKEDLSVLSLEELIRDLKDFQKSFGRL